MSTYTLTCEKRDLALKAKKVRQNGFVPAVVFGRHKDSLSIQIKENVAAKFRQINSVGSRVILDIDGEEQMAIFKDFQRDPVSTKILHIDFQALTSGEKIKVTLPVVYLNRDSINQDTYLQEQISEIEISTLPQFLIDNITVDISKYNLGDSIFVSDLDISSDENIEVLTATDTLICAMTHAVRPEEEPEDEEADGEEAAESTEEAEVTE